MKQRLLYAAYLVAVTAVWLYVQFPARTIRDYAIQTTASLVPGLALAVDRVGLSFPPGVSFENVAVRYQDAPALVLGQLRLRPGWKTLLPDQTAFAFMADIQGADVRGQAELLTVPTVVPRFLRLELDGVQMADLPILARQFGREMTGLCSGELIYTPPGSPVRLKASFVLEKGRVEIRQPVLKRKTISYDRIDSQIDMQGRSLALKRIVWQGPEIDGEFTGSIEVKSPLETSQIDIRGDIQPHSAFLTELRQSIPERLLPKPGPGGRYVVQLTGTVARPVYRILR